MSTWKSTLDDGQRKWVRDWWSALQPRELKSPTLPPSLVGFDRGDRAALRRAGDADALMLEPSTHLLADQIIAMDAHRKWRQFPDESIVHLQVAMVAGVLAHVRSDVADGRSLAWRLGRAAGHEQPLMSELRFKRLLKTRDETDLLRQWRRAVSLAEGTADVARLADDLLAWQIEQERPAARASEGRKFRWAYDYYLTKREQTAARKPASIEELNA